MGAWDRWPEPAAHRHGRARRCTVWPRLMTSRINTWLDASYFVPQKIGNLSLRLPRAKPAPEQIYSSARRTCARATRSGADPPRPDGTHVWFRTPNYKDRVDILDLYSARSTTTRSSTHRSAGRRSRDHERLQPASIQQVCSLALTYAQHDGRPKAGWADLTEAMVALESGWSTRSTTPTRRHARSRSTRPGTQPQHMCTCRIPSRRDCRSESAAARSDIIRHSKGRALLDIRARSSRG